LMYELQYYLGFRPGEVRLMKVSDVNFGEKTIFIPADNNKERNADNFPVNDFILDKIKTWLQKRKVKSQWLFPCFWNYFRHQDKPVDARTHQRNFTDTMKQLGLIHISKLDAQNMIRYNLNLYSFRHRFGTWAYNKFQCVKKTANVMRHYDLQFKSTWKYIHIAEKERRRGLVEQLLIN